MSGHMKLCVLGSGIQYTLSPRLHGVIFRVLGMRGEYSVEDIPPEKFDGRFPELMREYDGFNVTKPYKERAAAMLGAREPINTVRRDGKCTSTDPIGFITDYTANFGSPHGRILVLGAGGAAKSIVKGLLDYDTDIFVYNRTYEKAAAIAGGRVSALRDCKGRFDAVVNATSLGLNGEQAAPDTLDMSDARYAYDTIYSPPDTPFAAKARAAGAKCANGLGMLIRQAIASHEFWRSEKFSPETVNEIYAAAKKELAK